MRKTLAAVAAALAVTLVAPAAALAAKVPELWPPAGGAGHLFVHFGEEHWNDDDGMTLLPKVIEDSARFKPDLVAMSGDKADDGDVEQLEKWREIMGAFDKAGVPYFMSVGNHDRKAPPGVPGGVFPGGGAADFSNYRDVFKGNPYPVGDAAPHKDPLLSPSQRPEGDPEGASSHYFVDYDNVRFVFLDNSCWSFTTCDSDQFPLLSSEGFDTQIDYMKAKAKEAGDAGKHVFVVMHMPTRDPRDQGHADTISRMHTMGKGVAPDNDAFEQAAEEGGVDGVLVAHIKGQFTYRGRGDVRYYIDGGAGGELYTNGPVGVDHGYWHGYRLFRVNGDSITTDTVPIFVPNSITVQGPATVARGDTGQFEAFGKQPVFNDPAKVEALELRDPDPQPRGSSSGFAWATSGIGVLALPLLAFALLGILMRSGLLARGGLATALALAGLTALVGAGGFALAQQSIPTSTPKESLPTPARIWTSTEPLVLAPVASDSDDPRRDAKSQTDSGRFRARCPGRARVAVTSGPERRGMAATVPSKKGPIARRIQRGPRTARRGAKNRVVTISLAQPARLQVRIKRGGKTVRTLSHRCHASTKPLPVHWRAKGKRRPFKRGVYTVDVRWRSDRKSGIRRFKVRLR